MEGGFKHAHEPCARHDLPEAADGLEIRAVVRRGDEQVFAHGGNDFVSQLVYAVIAFGQHGFEAHGGYFAFAADAGHIR